MVLAMKSSRIGLAMASWTAVTAAFALLLPLLSILAEEKSSPKYAFLPWESNLELESSPLASHMSSLFPTTQLERVGTHAVTRDENFVMEDKSMCEEAELKKILDVARAKAAKGDQAKAHRLLEHALALCPRSPRVLNVYGEFLTSHPPSPPSSKSESKSKSRSSSSSSATLRADHMFVKALTYAPSSSSEHNRALANRQRTAAAVESIDLQQLERIDLKKDLYLHMEETQHPGLKRAKKEAYFLHVHHTTGIEGNTFSLAQTRHVLETKLAVAGKSVMEHNEILGLDAALKYINRTLVDRETMISVQDILDIHRRVMGFVEPLEAGEMRTSQVFVGDHVPPAVVHVQPLMDKFSEWLNDALVRVNHDYESGSKSSGLHPVRLAALAHYKLVYIHPFTDGNGRTARLLMNLILMRHGFPPVIVRKQDRLEYYKYLSVANEGDVRPFVRFLARCTERTLDAYLAVRDRTGEEDSPMSYFAIEEDEHESVVIGREERSLNYHEQVIMGGMVDV